MSEVTKSDTGRSLISQGPVSLPAPSHLMAAMPLFRALHRDPENALCSVYDGLSISRGASEGGFHLAFVVCILLEVQRKYLL